jgi:transcriptional regulator with XRE-family HTH domain
MCQSFTFAPDISDSYNRALMAGFGERIKVLREARGWKQDQLAVAANLSRDTILRAERSDNVRVNSLYQIAAALKVPITVLFGSRGKPVVQRRDREAARLLGELSEPQHEYVLALLRTFAGEDEDEDEPEAESDP